MLTKGAALFDGTTAMEHAGARALLARVGSWREQWLALPKASPAYGRIKHWDVAGRVAAVLLVSPVWLPLVAGTASFAALSTCLSTVCRRGGHWDTFCCHINTPLFQSASRRCKAQPLVQRPAQAHARHCISPVSHGHP